MRPDNTMRTAAVLVATALAAPALGQDYYVKAGGNDGANGQTWATAWATVTHALDQAVDGEVIWVAAGTYYPDESGDETKSFELKAGVELYGGFSVGDDDITDQDPAGNPTYLSGDVDQDDDFDTSGFPAEIFDSTRTNNAFNVITGSGEPFAYDGARVDGFIITGGHAHDASNILGGGVRGGGDMYVNCVFEWNSAEGRHGVRRIS